MKEKVIVRPMAHVVVAPVLLKSLTEICCAFGVTEKTVKGWFDSGAPIVLERGYSAELNALQQWRITERRQA